MQHFAANKNTRWSPLQHQPCPIVRPDTFSETCILYSIPVAQNAASSRTSHPSALQKQCNHCPFIYHKIRPKIFVQEPPSTSLSQDPLKTGTVRSSGLVETFPPLHCATGFAWCDNLSIRALCRLRSASYDQPHFCFVSTSSVPHWLDVFSTLSASLMAGLFTKVVPKLCSCSQY